VTRTQSNRAQERLALSTYVKLMRAANSARAYASQSLSDANLTLTQFAVLEALYHLGPMSLSDMRVLIVVLTAKGKTLLRNLFPRHASAIVEFLNVLSPEEQERLGELCRKLGKQPKRSA
jgi:MarR family 2-MHQ and catechol resistance regulon transcriptional repressor